MSTGLHRFGSLLRYCARALSLMIFGFWGLLIIAHLTGEAGKGSRALTLNDYLILFSLIVTLVGLLISWRWELIGSAVSFLALLVCAIVNWKVLIFPGALIPLTAVLFLGSWLFRRITSLTN